MKTIHLPCPDHPKATLEGYLQDCQIPLGHYENRPAVIVCPGGGYACCSPREADPVALRYAAQGFHAFVLNYSVGWEASGFAPLGELTWAISLLREKAAEWHLDPQRIAVCGFSAGGHLALASSVMGDARPNALILGYPVALLPNIPRLDFMLKLLTGKDKPTDEDAYSLSPINFITKDCPPAFLMGTAEDLLTPYGALAVANKYSQLGLGYERHVFQHGPHGYSLADATTAAGIPDRLNATFAQWHQLSVDWLYRVFGQPEHRGEYVSQMGLALKELGFEPVNLSKKP